MDILKFVIFSFIFFLFFSCVSPPEYTDGLLENIPAVVNDNDYFSLSIYGNDYKDTLDWDLELDLLAHDVLLTTLVVKDINVSYSDSSQLIMTVDLGDTIFNANILSDLVFASKDSVKYIGIPNRISFISDNFTGRLEYQLIKNSDI